MIDDEDIPWDGQCPGAGIIEKECEQGQCEDCVAAYKQHLAPCKRCGDMRVYCICHGGPR